jgi:pheromone shutdown protein TraB
MPDPSSETPSKGAHVVVLGTHHEFQRHQDTSADRERVRTDLEKLVRKVIEERKVKLVAEEASDDKAVWESMKKDEELAAGFGGLFGDFKTVDAPVPTIAKELAKEYGAKHADVDVDVRAQEGDAESIAKRDAAMTEKILSGRGDAESMLVIVGEVHRAGVSARLKNAGWTVESLPFPNT